MKLVIAVRTLGVSLLLLGCSAGGSSQALTVGKEGTGGAGPGHGGSGGTGVIVIDGGEPRSPLSAHIESPPGVTVTFVTISCANDCADVLAVATGGAEPYAYVWEDGSTAPSRHVCPTATTRYEVTARDAGVTSGEFPRPPAAAVAPLTASVLQCPLDAGVPPPPGDGGPPAHAPACVANGTFAGTPAVNVFGNFDAPPWVGCAGTADVFDQRLSTLTYEGSGLAPTDGTTALHVNSSIPSESVAQLLCAPMRAGNAYSFEVDLYAPVGNTLNPVPATSLDVWGGTAACAKTELLWSSPLAGPAWQTYCFTVTPTADTTHVMLEPHFAGSEGTVFVDNLVATDRCL